MEYQPVLNSELRRPFAIQSAAGAIFFATVLIAVLALLLPASAAAAASEPSGALEPVAEVASTVTELEPAPVEPSAASGEAEAAAPEGAVAPEEGAVAEEAAVPAAPASEPQPQPEPESGSAPAEAAGAGALSAPSLDPRVVEAAADVVRGAGEQLASAGEGAAPASATADAVESPAALGAGLEQTLAALVDSLPSLTLLEALSQDELSGAEGLIQRGSLTGSTAGPNGPAPVPSELLPSAIAQLPERRLPSAIDDPQEQASIPAGLAIPSPVPFAREGARVSSGSLTAPFPDLFVLPSAADKAQAGAAGAASAGQLPGPPAPDRSPFGHLGAEVGTGGSIFIPLLGVLALLALVAPRGHRRRAVSLDFPVPTPFVCALERPG